MSFSLQKNGGNKLRRNISLFNCKVCISLLLKKSHKNKTKVISSIFISLAPPTKKKGFSQRGSGNSVPSHFNESPFANSIPENSRNVNADERNSKKAEGRGVTRSDLEPDITVQAEDNSDIRAHPPAPKKKASKSTESDKAAKAEPKKEA